MTGGDCRYYAEVKETFAALLAKADVRMPHLTAAMADLLARRLAGGHASAKPTAADIETVNRMLMRIFSVDDVIYKKVRRCADTRLVCSISDIPPPPAIPGLHPSAFTGEVTSNVHAVHLFLYSTGNARYC